MLQRLAKFVEEDSSILKIWNDFVHFKTTPKRQRPSRINKTYFSIDHKTVDSWESWRKDISVELLSEIQRTCARAMKEFGYLSLFHMEDVRLMKRPSVSNSTCFTPPCT